MTTRAIDILRSTRLRALLSLGMVLGFGAVGTLAAWSTSTTTTSGAFTTGYIDLQVNSDQGNPTAYSVFTTPTGLLPGQSIAAMLPVQNKGNLPLTYTSTVTKIDPVGQALVVAVFRGGAVTNNQCTGGATVTGTPSGSLAATTGVDTLCLQFTLPSAAANTLQGQTGSVQFAFQAMST